MIIARGLLDVCSPAGSVSSIHSTHKQTVGGHRFAFSRVSGDKSLSAALTSSVYRCCLSKLIPSACFSKFNRLFRRRSAGWLYLGNSSTPVCHSKAHTKYTTYDVAMNGPRQDRCFFGRKTNGSSHDKEEKNAKTAPRPQPNL
ncbi:unnamed protein product [Soboliphyme baturini]|uniref:Secreted protein n=1 Tax=Soboliphyme baturini TaxID=241478 RepID=A0A183I9Y9_9BILA|nr:unnamed protein product [Soboliphyme baturini]